MHPTLRARLAASPPLNWLATARQWPARAAALLPGACALCAASGRHTLCAGCRAQFFSGTMRRCGCCALPLAAPEAENTLCGRCLQDGPAFDATTVVADYAAPLDQLVLGLKFGARLALAPLMAELLRNAVLRGAQSSAALPSGLTAVPLGAARLQERGFNQALEIAKPLAAALGTPLLPRLLVRVRDTAAQARLSPLERRRNLRGAFTLAPDCLDSVRGQHIGVVDDVMTTGATLNEVAATLKRFGAARVTNLVFARTLPK